MRGRAWRTTRHSPCVAALGGLATILRRFIIISTLLFGAAKADFRPFAVQITSDPSVYSMGWSHAFAIHAPETHKWLFMPLMGQTHSPVTDNSVRVYNPNSDQWTYWQKDLSKELTYEEWYAGESTSPPSASGRNNYMGFYLPWEGAAGQIWIAAPGGNIAGNHGIYDIAEQRWVHLVPNNRKPEFAPITYTNETAYKLVEGWNFADVVCGDLRTLVRYGGKNQGILVVVRPDEEHPGHYLATGYTDQPPGQRNSIRDLGICVDGNVYIFGGTKLYMGEALTEVWKLDVESLEWERMPPTPEPIPAGATVTYDPGRHSALIVFEGKAGRGGLYNLRTGDYDDLTDVLDMPTGHNLTGVYVPGTGHLYRGAAWGSGGWPSARQIWCISVSPGDSCGTNK